MKTIRFTLSSLALALLTVGCSDDVTTQKPGASAGDEVQFGASLPGKDSRTVYGNETATGFPIFWVNGDLVKVASPQCLAGRNVAEYKVSVASETQNYADQMDKTGEYGVQWGETDAADFYSIYPSNDATELNIDGNKVTAKLHVDAVQSTTTKELTENNRVYYYSEPAEMGNVVMYAKTTAQKTDEYVDLQYKPFSTVLEFTMSSSSDEVAGKTNSLTIQMLTLTAPEGTNIAGDFNFAFPAAAGGEPTVTPAETGGSRSISLHITDANGKYVVLSPAKNKLKAKMCLMPIGGVENLDGWTVEVTTNSGTFKKTLAANTADGKTTALFPGKVHKITLPELSYSSKEWQYSLTNWITSLPDYRNIYLTEISLPGAWYAGANENYQATDAQGSNGIAVLWNNGVRAFGVETRTESTNTLWTWEIGSHGVPENVVVSGTGNNSTYTYETGTNSINTTAGSKKSIYYDGTNIENIIGTIANKVAQTQEFAVLVLSYSDAGDTKGGTRYIDYGAWLKLLETAYSRLTVEQKAAIYQGPIDANTTVDKVVGKLIIKINVDANIAKEGYFRGTTYAYEGTLPALFSYNPFLFQMKDANYTTPYYSNLSWKTWGDGSDYRSYDLVENLQSQDAASNADKFIWVFSSANRTHTDNPTTTIDIPTYAQRKEALRAMGDYSKKIYDASTHNVWFYFNCGGTQAESSTSDSNLSPTDFATEMNKWLLNQIKAKTDASPLGIVMFNQCTSDTYNGPAIVKAIIEMNSKFYLKHAGVSGGSTGGSTTQTAQNNSTYKFGGSAF